MQKVHSEGTLRYLRRHPHHHQWVVPRRQRPLGGFPRGGLLSSAGGLPWRARRRSFLSRRTDPGLRSGRAKPHLIWAAHLSFLPVNGSKKKPKHVCWRNAAHRPLVQCWLNLRQERKRRLDHKKSLGSRVLRCTFGAYWLITDFIPKWKHQKPNFGSIVGRSTDPRKYWALTSFWTRTKSWGERQPQPSPGSGLGGIPKGLSIDLSEHGIGSSVRAGSTTM